MTEQRASENDTLFGYLFIHFIGEQEDGEQIYFALSQDGLHWHDLNNQQPVLRSNVGERGVRDPYLLRSADGSRFYLLATDLSIYHRGGDWSQTTITGSRSLVIWESSDLVNWSEPRTVEVAPIETGCAWAPEAIYDEAEEDYLVFWASGREAAEGEGRGMHIYCSKTRDFRTFTPAVQYITRGEQRTIIDTTIMKAGGKYYRASGDGQITIEASDRLMGDWEVISTLESIGLKLTGRDVEGPEFFKFNGEDQWGLLVDQYATKDGYLPIVTTDIGDTTGSSWKKLAPDTYSFGSLKKRHGSILPITKQEYVAILDQWGK
ncbi:sucrose-6-phosphate hydrolase SacC (GH32 family) [Paenibacillus phyllosphaerae]|uniref:Sucrose-6-phosphate hydrolase SacC (GH32 family) n=1 Tax=Paenibacillus phyllosphaerae TaxID=274593 RepID=A0A7W5B2A1_9BACL|nr:glycoside hydrolase family 43 protein [Paenibacillus phyllosphaerae]MBB3113122.1 sucrose-6-phosphate hydrolase SacC (GH32 family) [Paenibacillus phyllosphaerae]